MRQQTRAHDGPAPSVAARFEAGIADHRAGRLAEAEAAYRAVLTETPDHAEALSAMGVLAIGGGQTDLAWRLFRAAIAADPGLGTAWGNLASACRQRMWLGQAATAAIRAALLAGHDSRLFYQAGQLALQAGIERFATIAQRIAVALTPGDYDAVCGLAMAAAGPLGDPVSIPWYRRAHALAPDAVGASSNLAQALARIGDHRGAGLYFRAERGDGEATGRLRAAMTMPVVASSRAEIADCRAAFEATLDDLLDAAQAGRLPMPDIFPATNFMLAYHDENDCAIQRKFATLYRAANPSLTWQSPWLDHRPPGAGNRIRIGFLSELLFEHTIGHLSQRLIAGLPTDRFHKTVILPPRASDPILDRVIAGADRALVLHGNLAASQRMIAEARLDLLVYLDIGMTPLTLSLAHARLAPRQCVMMGHPDTTGIPTIDAFISNQAMEPDDGRTHYTERLIATRGLNFHYAPPPDRGRLKDREALGLPTGRRLYLCPQPRFKCHPDFDPIVRAILDSDPDGLFVATAGHNAHLDRLYLDRVFGRNAALRGRTRIMPPLSATDFVALAAACDVVLDTPHFSGGFSSQEIFSADVPIVTWPGRFMRGRHTAGFYREMGIEDAIARDHDHYVDLALDIARTPDRRRDLSARIAERKHMLADHPETVPAMADALATIARGGPA